MRVALNLLYLVEQGGGVSRYMEELCGALVREGVPVVALHSRELPERVRSAPWASDVEWVEQPVTVTHGPPWSFLTLTYRQWRTHVATARERGAQVLHGPAYIGPPRARGIATVVSVPDLIYTRHPGLLDARTRLGMRLLVRPSVRGADRVIAISEAVCEDVVATLGVPRERVDVTPLGVRVDPGAAATPERTLRERLALGAAPLVLVVAQKRPHKNLEGLLCALRSVPDAVVALVGFPTPYEQRLEARASELGVAARVRHVGYVDEPDLEGLYRMATCCCLPSFDEGFGLPVIEAMARGTPVACSGSGALAEVAGDAAQTFDPHDPQAIASALRILLAAPARRDVLRAAGLERAAQYSWERCARETLRSYRLAVKAAGMLASGG